MISATFKKYPLQFTFNAGTSRGVLPGKNSWFIFLRYNNNPEIAGIGECSVIPGLSIDDRLDYEKHLTKICESISYGEYNFDEKVKNFPSIQFGLEMALRDLKRGGEHILYPSDFTDEKDSIAINGLVWMDEVGKMKTQIKKKIEDGFPCIKIKVGALPFEQELKLIRDIRNDFGNDLEIRLDANGGFSIEDAMDKLRKLSEYSIHSIEQPIKPGNAEEMAKLCKNSPIAIALDEELIGVHSSESKQNILEQIKPQYIILKPSLIGGFKPAEEWIALANEYKTGWWVTSALESNIGLNALSQWVYTLQNKLPQGLGTGQIFSNNFKSPLYLSNNKLFHSRSNKWNLEAVMDMNL